MRFRTCFGPLFLPSNEIRKALPLGALFLFEELFLHFLEDLALTRCLVELREFKLTLYFLLILTGEDHLLRRCGAELYKVYLGHTCTVAFRLL